MLGARLLGAERLVVDADEVVGHREVVDLRAGGRERGERAAGADVVVVVVGLHGEHASRAGELRDGDQHAAQSSRRARRGTAGWQTIRSCRKDC